MSKRNDCLAVVVLTYQLALFIGIVLLAIGSGSAAGYELGLFWFGIKVLSLSTNIICCRKNTGCRMCNAIYFTLTTIFETFMLIVLVAAMQLILGFICAIIHSANSQSEESEECIDTLVGFTVIMFIVGAIHVLLTISSTVILWCWSLSSSEDECAED